jgi:penicillin amidase
MRRGLIRAAAALMLIGVIGVGGAWFWLRSTLPQTSGTITLTGLHGTVTITREAYGVPTIKADRPDDAYFALGFVHAQDRLWQMDLQRRLGAGRLAEVFGADALPIDRQMRGFGLYRHAAASLAHVSPEFRAVLDAYTAGVNAYLDRQRRLPVEFAALGYRPEIWRAEDSMVFGKLLALELSGNYRRELLRARLSAKLTTEQIEQLFPGAPKDGPIALQSLSELYKLLPFDRMLQSLPPLVGPTPASNNWVVDGTHSTTGKPLLANDPHLDFSAPGIWYLARLDAPGLQVAGGTLAGTPLVVLGHNERIAWGYTTTDGDVEDLFIERLDPSDRDRYLTPEGSAAFVTRRETIAVKGRSSETATIRETRHGPVISDVLPKAAGFVPADHVVALAATFFNDDDRSLEAQYRITQARDWPGFIDALTLFTAPEQNMVYADVDGNIGFYAPGHLPIRRAGDGRAPVPGWSGEYDWTGLIPFADLPHLFNPQNGRIATADNQIAPDDDPALSTADWAQPLPAPRIEVSKQSIAASTEMMRDPVSPTARQLLPLLLAVAPESERQRRAHDLLAGWDGRMVSDRPEPLVFTAWLRALNKRIYADELGELFPEYRNMNPLFIASVLTKYPKWCDDVTTREVETCDRQVTMALDDALGDLTGRYGPDMAHWRWGEPHEGIFGNPVFKRLAVLRDMFDRSVAADGDTVNAGAFRMAAPPAPYLDVHGAGLRAIYDLGDLERSVFMIAPGQSGNMLSRHYDDLLPLWHSFEWLRLPRETRGERLELEPPA